MSNLANIFFTHRIQIFSIAGSILLFAFIITLIKKRRLKEEYAMLWLATCVFFAIISIFRSLLEYIADLAGIHYAPAALLLVLTFAITVILIHYSTVISKLSEQNKVLTQELAILRSDLQGSQVEK